MKKTAFILAVAAVMAMGVTAFAAAEYVPEDVVSVDEIAGYETVLISKGEDAYSGNTADIVYLDQFNGGIIDITVNFMLKPDTDDGTYRILLGKTNGDTTYKTFVVSHEAPPPEKEDLVYIGGDESYKDGFKNMAFVAEGVNLSDYNAIQITVTDPSDNSEKSGGYMLNELIEGYASYDGPVNFGLQINNIPDAYKDSIKVSLVRGATTDGQNAWE